MLRTSAGLLIIAAAGSAAAQCPPLEFQPSGTSSGDRFGAAVHLDGNRAIVGAELDDATALDSGSAYVFRLEGSEWVEEGQLIASDGAEGDHFGSAVAMSGDVAVVGAWRRRSHMGSDTGTAYVFRFGSAGWTQEARLIQPVIGDRDRMGWSVAIDGDVIVVGSPGNHEGCGSSLSSTPGTAFVYRYDGSEWLLEQQLFNPVCLTMSEFGSGVAIDGDVIVVGAWRDEPPRRGGSATFFRFDGAEWQVETKALLPDPPSESWFGCAVAVDGDTAVIGAQYRDETERRSGAAYVYLYDSAAEQWQLEQKLISADATELAEMGASVAISGERVVLGAPLSDAGDSNAGAAIVFARESGRWNQIAALHAEHGQSLARFGAAVSIDGDRVLAGAPAFDRRRVDDGLALSFDLAGCSCRADVNGDGTLDFFDFLEFQSLFAAGDPRADFTGDGVLDFFDFLEFQTEFAAGCP